MRDRDQTDRGPSIDPGDRSLDRLADRFEAEWQSGGRPSIESYLSTATEGMRGRLLVELLRVELELRRSAGEQPTLDEYQARFPDYYSLLEQVFAEPRAADRQTDDVESAATLDHGDSDRARGRRAADAASLAVHGLKVRCPHCRNPIELVDSDALTELTCPSCGSSFNLVDGESTVTYAQSTVKQLGHFELVEQLGMGAFGSVWKARDTELDRVVAIKIPRKDRLHPEEMEKFFREARAAAQLRHPSIVSVHEVGRDGDTVYIVSDLVRGVTLSDWLSGQKPTPREAAELCAQIAEALHHAHEQGVIHRDLKPGNIMLDAEGRPYIMDFGLAKREAGEITMTVEGQVLGTPAYMSPEQARGEGHEVDRRTDIYSLGVILFQLLTGEIPFRGTPRMLLHQVLHDEPRTPRSLNDRIPRDLETICLKAMAKEPGRRYATARELADDLRRWLKGESILARPVGRLERGWRWCKRNRAVTALTSAVVLLLVVGISVSSCLAVNEQLQRLDAIEQRRLAEAQRDKAKLERDRAERLLYASQIARAQTSWDAGDAGGAWNALASCAPELQDWEHDYLKARFDQGEATLLGHTHYVWRVAFSSDGGRLASASWDTTIRLWDVQSGDEIQSFDGHMGQVLCVAFSPDGLRLISSGENGELQVWDAASGTEQMRLESSELAVPYATFSHDGNFAASAHADGDVRVWDLDTGKRIRSLDHGATFLAYSPDDSRIATAGHDGSVKIWDARTGEQIHALLGHAGNVTSLAFSSDGKQLASAGEDKRITIWDLSTGQAGLTWEAHSAFITAIAYSPDDRTIVSGGWDNLVKVWNAANGRPERTLKGHAGVVTSVAYSPDGRRIASSSFDMSIKLWHVEEKASARTIEGHTDVIQGIAFSPNGTCVASGSADETIRIWNLDDGHEQARFAAHSAAFSVTFSPDGRHVACGCSDSSVRVWDTSNGLVNSNPQIGKAHESLVQCVAFSPDGMRLASASWDRTVRLWKSTDCSELAALRGHSGEVWSVAFCPDGTRLASSGANGEVKVWDLKTNQETMTLLGHTGAVACVVYSADSRMIASAGVEDRTIRIWNASNGQLLRKLDGHSDGVMCVAFSPSARRLASVGGDRTMRIWDVRSGQEMLTLQAQELPVTSVAFSPDGQQIATGSWDKTIKIWNAKPAVR